MNQAKCSQQLLKARAHLRSETPWHLCSGRDGFLL